MVGHSAAGFIHPEDLESTREEMRAARRGRNTRYFECRYVHKDGHAVLLQWTGVWSEQEQLHYFIGRDMTERQLLSDILSNTISSMVDAVLVADAAGTVVISNPAAERLMGIVAGSKPACGLNRMK